MEKYICKAKTREDNWVYGYYVAVPDEYTYGKDICHAIFSLDCEHICMGEYKNWGWYEVNPDTVCCNTGMTEFVMTDKSVCSPLFEGDIVEVWSRRRPYGESITLYRDYTTSQYDAEVKARAVIRFKRGQWCLDYDNAYNKAICELKGNEQNARTVKASPDLYDFGVHRSNAEWFIEHNQRCKWHDIVKIGNIHDNKELLEV